MPRALAQLSRQAAAALSPLHPQSLLAGCDPESEVGKSGRLGGFDAGKIAEPRDCGVERSAKDPQPSNVLAPIVPLVAAEGGLNWAEFDNQLAVEKVSSSAPPVRDGTQKHETGGIEDRCVVIAV
jgi:hypothetical protein